MKYLILVVILLGCKSNEQDKAQLEMQYSNVIRNMDINQKAIELDSSLLIRTSDIQRKIFFSREIDSLRKDQQRLMEAKIELSEKLFK